MKTNRVTSPSPVLILSLLGVVAFCLAIKLDTARRAGMPEESEEINPLKTLLGDGRRLFANHVFVKADVYFHSGYYPSIFDDQSSFHTPHMALYSGAVDQEKNTREAKQRKPLFNILKPDDADGSPGAARDIIERFSHNFYPVRHTHLDQQGKPGDMREILPWLRLTVELDPHNVDAYVVASYWLRREFKKDAEAEAFLRDGLKHNPDSCEIYFELGRLQLEDHQQPDRARNLWLLALRKWDQTEAGQPEPNRFIYLQVTGQLAKLEEHQGDYARALYHLRALREISPQQTAVDEWIAGVWEKLGAEETVHPLNSGKGGVVR